MDNVKDFKQEWIALLSEEIDTYVLQVESLREFLRHIGYEIAYQDKNDTWHIKKSVGNKLNMPMFLSLDQAVSLHNGTCYLMFDSRMAKNKSLDIALPVQLLKDAHKQQLVYKVFLQRDKGEWKVQKNQVRFVKDGFSPNEEIMSTY